MQFERRSTLESETLIDFSKPGAIPGEPASITIELFLQPDTQRRRIAPIVSLYDTALPANVLIAQWRSELLMRTPVPDSRGSRRFRETGIGNFLEGKPSFVAITSGPEGTSFYLDGKLVETYDDPVLRNDTVRGRLRLGDSPTGGPGWIGKFYGLAIFSEVLTPADIIRHHETWTAGKSKDLASEPGISGLFLFDEGEGRTVRDYSPAHNKLVVPEYYRAPRKTSLLTPGRGLRPDFSDVADVMVNILGFVPFGFFFLFYLSRFWPRFGILSAAVTVILGAVISMGIEVTQVILPTRSSSMTDLICNTAGAAFGVVLAQVYQARTGNGRRSATS
jgi:VanZ family protein